MLCSPETMCLPGPSSDRSSSLHHSQSVPGAGCLVSPPATTKSPGPVGCGPCLTASRKPSLKPQPQSSCFLKRPHGSMSLPWARPSVSIDGAFRLNVFAHATLGLVRAGPLTATCLQVLRKCLWDRQNVPHRVNLEQTRKSSRPPYPAHSWAFFSLRAHWRYF